MTYVHYATNGSMIDDLAFLATDDTTRLGVGQYSGEHCLRVHPQTPLDLPWCL